jgi:hypothetical protein
MRRPRLPDPEPSKAKPVTAAQIRAMAKTAIARRAPGQGKRVTLALRITLTRERAEELSAAAIREERNLEDVVGEIVEG